MSLNRRDILRIAPAAVAALLGQRPNLFASCPSGAELVPQAPPRSQSPSTILPRFAPVQPDLFGATGGQPNCWGDFDNDGNLDLFVGFTEGVPNRLYRNDQGTFRELAASLGMADLPNTRAAAWGDFNGDGNLDLYVGFTRKSGVPNKLYRNDGDGKHFTEIGHAMGVDAMGETRQVSWVDFDNDGRIDLFVGFRDAPNMLFHNERDHFVNVAKEMGVDDPRKTVGAVWFDMNQDGRLDLYVANQDGTLNGFFRNDGSRFVDVAHELGMDAEGRPTDHGSCGPSVVDYDNDGMLDLFVAGYGPNFLYRNNGKGKFTDVAAEVGLVGGDLATTSSWGDYDNDGWPDLYVTSYIEHAVNERDYLYRNAATRFADVIPAEILDHMATHGVQWADYDGDGALDLAVANNMPGGCHYLFRNMLPPDRARRSVLVQVLDEHGHHTRAGSEVRIYVPEARKVLGTRLVDTGSGYCSQNQMPVHFGVPNEGPVDVEITTMTRAGRKITKVLNVDPNRLARRTLVVKIDASGSS